MPRGLIPAETASFLAVCRVLDLMDTIKKSGVGDRILRELKQEVARNLRLHVAAYGCDWVKPKHHYMIHMPRQVEEDGVWLDCFVHERKHQVIKEAASHIKNTTSYEKNVLVPRRRQLPTSHAGHCQVVIDIASRHLRRVGSLPRPTLPDIFANAVRVHELGQGRLVICGGVCMHGLSLRCLWI